MSAATSIIIERRTGRALIPFRRGVVFRTAMHVTCAVLRPGIGVPSLVRHERDELLLRPARGVSRNIANMAIYGAQQPSERL
jgi:hypothetical protein